MTTNITITPDFQNLSPALAGKHAAYGAVNNDFIKSFGDVLDAINPLQHIPIVSDIYRALTGDTISTGAQILGGGIFGGPVGLFASVADVIFESEAGSSPAGALMAMATGKYDKASSLS